MSTFMRCTADKLLGRAGVSRECLTCDQAFLLFFFFLKGGRGERKKEITPSSRERHRGIIGRGYDLRLREC